MFGTTKTVKDLSNELAPPREEDKTDGVIPVRIEERGLGSFEFLRDGLLPTMNLLLSAAIALVFAFVMLLHWDDLSDRLIRLVGQRQIPVTTQALAEASTKVSSYLARFLLLNGIHGILVAIVLSVIGVPNALLLFAPALNKSCATQPAKPHWLESTAVTPAVA